jgi:uncharacterized RDD family membrane protein YckC
METPAFAEAQPPPLPARAISRFWPRIWAFLLDALVLGGGGMLLGLFCFDALAHMGDWARLIGFAFCLLYFGVMGSSLGGGQTLGQRLLKIAVVDRHGRSVSLGRSCARAAILGIPYVLNGAFATGRLAGLLVSLGGVGIGGAILYLYLFNRRSRQSLHDLATGTYVVGVSAGEGVAAAPLWRGHLVVVALWFALAASGACFNLSPVIKASWFAQLVKVQQAILASGDVRGASVNLGKNTTIYNGVHRTTNSLSVAATWKRRPIDYQASASEIAAIVLNQYAQPPEVDQIRVTIVYGYTLGIASGWVNRDFTHSPAEWQALLGKKDAGAPELPEAR